MVRFRSGKFTAYTSQQGLFSDEVYEILEDDFGFFWMSAVAYANETTPDHLKSTSQGLLYSILNVANMAGAPSSGALWDKFGPHGLFWGMAAFSAAGMVVFVVGRKRGVGK